MQNIKRGRPKGSTNKPKNTNVMKVINLNKHIDNSPIINDNTPYEWISYGSKNNYPTELLNLYHNSIIHKSCVDFLVAAILGEGIDFNAMKMEGTETYPNFNDSWETFMHKIILDYILFGSFSFQVIKNKDGKTYSYYHQPFSTVRFGKKDENGDIKFAYICKDWSNTIVNKPIQIPIFNFTDDVNISSGKAYLFVYNEYNPFDEYYSTPSYISAIDAIRTDIEMKNYDLNATLNMFTPSGILTLNQVSDDDERNMILKNIEATFTSSENANNIIVAFRNNVDDKPVEFTAIAQNSEGVNMFADTTNRTTDRIIAAHRIPNKALIGMPMDSTGFSNEGSLLQTSYNLLEKVVISNIRKKIVGYINKMFGMNGIETEIIIKPLSFNLNNLKETQTTNTNEVNKIDDNNIDYKSIKY